MNLSSASTLLPKPPLLNSTDSSLQTGTGNFQDHSLTRTDNIFPSFKSQNPFLRNPPTGNFQVLDDDEDLVMYEPVKKTRVDDHTMNMLAGSNVISSQLPREKGFRKTAEFQQYRPPNPLAHFEKPVFDEQRQSKDNSDMSTYNSNTSFSDANAFKREIIDLEDDGVVVDKNQLGKDRNSDSLLMTDDIIGNLSRTKDNLVQQLLLRNLLSQPAIPPPNPLVDPQMALLTQLMQASQYNQLNPRGFGNPLINPLLQNSNPLMMSSLLYNMKLNNLNNLARQPQFPFPGSDFSEPVSLQGKRTEPQLGFDNFNFPQPRPIDTKSRHEVILLDDDDDDIRVPPVKNNNAFWSINRYERRKIFKIVKTTRKAPPVVVNKKKQVFTVIRLKPGQKPFRGFIGKKKVYNPRGNDDAGSDSKGFDGAEGVRRSSRRLRGARIEESSAYRESMAIRALREARDFKPVIEDYVINVHINENDENEEISETPIGDNFQVKLVPFCIDMDATRPVRQVWDPETVDEELIKSCIEKIESKFDKKTVGEEIIVKTLKKFDMDVDKVIEELETNKMTFKNFFEVKTKVLRSRVLHHYL